MIDRLHFNTNSPRILMGNTDCPLFKSIIDIYIDPQVSIGYAVEVIEHWRSYAWRLVDSLTKYTHIFSEDFCTYVREDLDSMIEAADYPKVTDDLFIDLRELLLRWNIDEDIARAMVKRVKDRIGSQRKLRNLATVKTFFKEEILATLPEEDQPYHLIRPEIRQDSDILHYVKPFRFNITQPKLDVVQVYLSLDCAWDGEYGLAWLIRDGKVLYVGSDKELNVWLPDADYQDLEGNYVYGNILMKHELPDIRE